MIYRCTKCGADFSSGPQDPRKPLCAACSGVGNVAVVSTVMDGAVLIDPDLIDGECSVHTLCDDWRYM